MLNNLINCYICICNSYLFVALSFRRVALIIGLLPIITQGHSQEQPKYIFINSAPNRIWSVTKPSTFSRKHIDEIIQKINAPENKNLRVGISYIFDFLQTDLDSVEKSLDNFMSLSVQTNVPILINLDGANWWAARPDLWNWWDRNMPGYNPANRKNVEWTGWDDSLAIKISWRNWGRQIRILPAPNLMSSAVLSAHIGALKRLIPRVINWYNTLPLNQKYLFGGLKLGWETSIGVSDYHYKDGNRYVEKMPDDPSLDPRESYNATAGFSGGLAPLGYAAVKTAGIKNKGRITQDDMAQIIKIYLDTLCKTAHDLGLEQKFMYTHQGGTYAPWEKHLTFASASNQYAYPGWSFYATDPHTAGNMSDVLDKREKPGWAAVEWWWPGDNKTEWIYNLQRTLSYKDCRLMAIYNWEGGLEKDNNGIQAVKEVVAKWNDNKQH